MSTTREPYLSAPQVADWLGITLRTVREWARTGVIRGHQPGGRIWLFRASEIEADIAKSSQRPAAIEPPQPERRRRAPVVSTIGPVTSLQALRRQGRLG
jgi:excisionase family DNA binding protein